MYTEKLPYTHYIKGIDGLRAIAVLAVMLFHLKESYLPGGFSGVDIFFVISGYVVSGSLARNYKTNLFSFTLDFYSRRIIRIFPALIVCLVFTSFIASLFIPESWLSSTSEKTGLYAFFGLSNYALIWFNDGYFSPRVDFNPFTHTWSLGLEEQFYLIYPLLFFIWFKYKKRQGILGVISNGLLIALLFISLYFSWYETTNNPDNAFYLLPSRFWELASGALLYRLKGYEKLTSPWVILSKLYLFFGLALILLGFIFSNKASFPFPWAILSVSGALLLILGLTHPFNKKFIIQRVFENSIMVYIGKISYSLYLWHWAVYVIFRWTLGLETILNRTLAIFITLFFAMMSYHFIEVFIAKNKFIRRKENWKIFIMGLIILSGAFKLSSTIFKFQPDISLSVTKDQATWYPLPWTENDNSTLKNEFSGRNLFVLGDSHTSAYSTLFKKLTDEQGVQIHQYAVGCSYANLIYPVDPACKNKLKTLIPIIKKLSSPNDIIFLASLRLNRVGTQWGSFKEQSNQLTSWGVKVQKVALNEASALIQEFRRLSLNVMIDAPKPVFRSPPFRCSDWFNKNNPICASGFTIKRKFLLERRKPIMDSLDLLAIKFPQLIIWDPFPILCKTMTCSAFEKTIPLFFDGDHLSAYGNRLLYPSFESKVKQIWSSKGNTSDSFKSRGNLQFIGKCSF
ncbi:MAG: acyltransferase family protein [Methylococcales bacterium]|nr:acyltransferase family protein [Methylococcales bacterium]